MNQAVGAKRWFIPDGYFPTTSSGMFPSHEALCVLNPSPRDARIDITLYFEDQEKMEGFHAECRAERTNHIRMDQLKNDCGQGVPSGVPYAMMVASDVEIIVQYSRMDTTQPAMALMTTVAFAVN